MSNYAALRKAMVDGQLKPCNVTDLPILESFGRIPREKFVPVGKEDAAYIEGGMRIHEDCYLMAPMMLARMIQSLGSVQGVRVCDVACGLGYSTAILSSLGAKGVGVESDASVCALAAEMQTDYFPRFMLVNAPLLEGITQNGPFDRMLINGRVEMLPDLVFEHLSDGGSVIALRGDGATGCVEEHTVRDGKRSHRVLFEGAAGELKAFKKLSQFSLEKSFDLL